MANLSKSRRKSVILAIIAAVAGTVLGRDFLVQLDSILTAVIGAN